jgi:hypothetical protein
MWGKKKIKWYEIYLNLEISYGHIMKYVYIYIDMEIWWNIMIYILYIWWPASNDVISPPTRATKYGSTSPKSTLRSKIYRLWWDVFSMASPSLPRNQQAVKFLPTEFFPKTLGLEFFLGGWATNDCLFGICPLVQKKIWCQIASAFWMIIQDLLLRFLVFSWNPHFPGISRPPIGKHGA